jgi:hypothetical protein
MLSKWPTPKRGSENPRAIYTKRQVQQMRERRDMGGITYRQLAEEYGGSIKSVQRAVKGERYPDS